MAPPILYLKEIELTFGGKPLLVNAELSVSAGDRLCLVGRNGSGKSTLMKIAAGQMEPDSGEVFKQPGVTVRYLAQEPDIHGFASVKDYVLAGLSPGDGAHGAAHLLDQLGLDGTEIPATLSGGEIRRAAIVRALLPAPDILLLDEPTNHMDLPAIEWLETELARRSSALVLISHDRRFLENLTEKTIWLEHGSTRQLHQGFAAFETWRDEITEQAETERHKLDRKIVAETAWLHKGVTARRKRNQGRLRALRQLRAERRQQLPLRQQLASSFAEGQLSGKRVIDAEGVSVSFGDKRVIKDFSTRVVRGDRVGIVGPNGVGKTTLLNVLTGETEPTNGTVRLGTNLQTLSIDQRRENLNPNLTLADTLSSGGDMVSVNGQPRHVISYMKDFLFLPEQAGTPVGALSGGERGRLLLARALAQPSNLLVLDEPTNDLDLETLDLLQEMLAEYSGTVLLVSHDRVFLDRVVTSIVASDGGGTWIEYAGGYTDMLAQRGQAGASGKRPSGKSKQSTQRQQRRSKTGRKLTYKDQYALEMLPARMSALQAEITELQNSMADPDFFRTDPDGFARNAARLRACEKELGAAEDQWLELELKREESESA